MATVELRSGAWYGDRAVRLEFPDGWDVTVAQGAHLAAMTDDGIRGRLRQPTGTRPLAELARGRRRAAVIIDDIMRPTPTARLLPLVLEELAAGGIARQEVCVVIGSGA